LLCLDNNGECSVLAEDLHNRLEDSGIDVLFDDREERPGVKFKDADLIGCPLRIVVGAKGLKDGIVEMKWREKKETEKIPKDIVFEKILENLNDKLGKRV
jgi:prolyl-tRNA synthetase